MTTSTIDTIVSSLPSDLYLKAVRSVTGLELNNFGDLPIDAECIGLEEYAHEVHNTFMYGLIDAIAQKHPLANPLGVQLSAVEIRDVCFLGLRSLDKLVYDIYALPEGTPNKFSFEFVSSAEKQRVEARNFSDVPEGIISQDHSRSEPEKTCFDKEDYVRVLKNDLWAHFNQKYNLSGELE